MTPFLYDRCSLESFTENNVDSARANNVHSTRANTTLRLF